jgi:8-oxo-dGTP pyrophosphatase MutT (NUDIX family)
VRAGAVRELEEETGLQVDPGALVPVGYERITIEAGDEMAPWEAGDNHIAVFGARVPLREPVAPLAADVSHAEWVDLAEARRRCGDQHWWGLVESWFRR